MRRKPPRRLVVEITTHTSGSIRVVTPEQERASDGLEHWPQKVRLLCAADRALRLIGNIPEGEK